MCLIFQITFIRSTLPVTTAVNTATSTTLGNYLTDGNGLTLYMYQADTLNTSACYGTCATFWPPYLLTTATKATAGTGVTSTMLGTTTRTDNTVQVTYNGKPLYYYKTDLSLPNSILGQGKGSEGTWWFIVRPTGLTNFMTSTRPANLASANTLEVTTTKYGTSLVDSKGIALYTYNSDTFLKSNCYTTCATTWTPYTIAITALPTYGTGVDGGLLWYATRTDATRQVTYNGMPLYYYASDTAMGSITGQGVGSNWWLVNPTGSNNKIITSNSNWLNYGLSLCALLVLMF